MQETDTFGHEPALVARTSPAQLFGFPKFVGTPRCSDARRCHPCAWRNQGALAAMAYRRTSKQPRRVAICTDRQQRGTRLHSITSSARASSVTGISMPIVLAVFVLITSSNFVGRSIGKSAGFAPLNILSTNVAAREYSSA